MKPAYAVLMTLPLLLICLVVVFFYWALCHLGEDPFYETINNPDGSSLVFEGANYASFSGEGSGYFKIWLFFADGKREFIGEEEGDWYTPDDFQVFQLRRFKNQLYISNDTSIWFQSPDGRWKHWDINGDSSAIKLAKRFGAEVQVVEGSENEPDFPSYRLQRWNLRTQTLIFQRQFPFGGYCYEWHKWPFYLVYHLNQSSSCVLDSKTSIFLTRQQEAQKRVAYSRRQP